jgi:hypothetical protein
MKRAIKILSWISPVLALAALVSYMNAMRLARGSPDSFDGIEWMVAGGYLLVVALFAPLLAFCLWVVDRGQNM